MSAIPAAWSSHLARMPHHRASCLRFLHRLGLPPDRLGNELGAMVDASPFSLGQWLEAIGVFQEWLEAQDRNDHPQLCLEYLACACGSPEAALGWSLAEVAREMLEVHGFEGGGDPGSNGARC